jgi:hypothetical protein
MDCANASGGDDPRTRNSKHLRRQSERRRINTFHDFTLEETGTSRYIEVNIANSTSPCNPALSTTSYPSARAEMGRGLFDAARPRDEPT